jgi:RHS repeat-associated protein
VDETGKVISYEEYHPYGTTAYWSGAGAAEVSLKRYRYTGKERDDETGLYYFGARYCAAWLGRWTAADPAGMVDGPNLYAYVKGNPVRMLDRKGTQSGPPGSPKARSPRASLPSPGSKDYDIMTRKDPQLLQHMRALEASGDLAEFLKGATGEFKVRAEAMKTKYGLVTTAPTPAERVAQKLTELAGKLRWAGESHPDEDFKPSLRSSRPDQNLDPEHNHDIKWNPNSFAAWIRGGPEPARDDMMNCYEAILFGAYKTGALTFSDIQGAYKKAEAEGQAAKEAASKWTGELDKAAGIDPQRLGAEKYTDVLKHYLHEDVAKPLTDKSEPQRGDLVFFQGLQHVAISLGTRVTPGGARVHDVMSLWLTPTKDGKFDDRLVRTTVEELRKLSPETMNPVTFAPGPW